MQFEIRSGQIDSDIALPEAPTNLVWNEEWQTLSWSDESGANTFVITVIRDGAVVAQSFWSAPE